MLAATSNNTNASETVSDVLKRLDEQIRQFESDLARGELSNRGRSDLSGMLRQAKALRASLTIAMESGDLSSNSLLFDNRGMPTAKRGSFLFDVLKRAEESTGLFSMNWGNGPKGPAFGPEGGRPGYGPEGGRPGYGPKGPAMGPGPKGLPAPPIWAVTNVPTGLPGVAYPNLAGYVFGRDGRTAILKAAGRPMPNKWPAIGTNDHFVYGNGPNFTETHVKEGYHVPGTTKTYWGANALTPDGSMTYPDGIYANELAIPPTASTVTSAQSSGNKLYIPQTAGAAVSGRPTHVHAGAGTGISSADATAAAPYQYTVAANIPWQGSGTSHVFQTNGASLAKSAGVVVPGQTTKVYNEALSVMNVTAGAFVPGSGTHSRGGAVRNKVYTGTNPSGQHTWTAGLDTPWDGNAATRFNIDGGSATYAAGQAYPGQTNKVFDTNFAQYTKATGKEVPGSSGYDRTDSETSDADGIGPAAQVYNASLNPINKTRGNLVPGDNTRVYTATGANAAVSQPAVGSAVLEAGGGTSSTHIYFTGAGAAVTSQDKRLGIPDPTNVSRMYDPSGTSRTISTTTTDRGDGVSAYRMRLNPAQDVWYAGQKESATAAMMIFDPAKYAKFSVNLGDRVAAGERPPVVLLLPDGATYAAVGGGMQVPLDQVLVAPLHADWRSGSNPTAKANIGQFVPWRDAAGGGMLPGDAAMWTPGAFDPNQGGLGPEAALHIVSKETVSSGGAETQGQFITASLGRTSPMNMQGMGASTSTTSSSRSSGGYRSMMNDPRNGSRWF